MNRFIAIIFAAAFAALSAAPAPAATRHHSIAEYAYLIGTWQCVAHAPRLKAPVTYQTSFHWKYPSKSVIDQYISTPRGQANFMLTYVPASDSFEGVFTGSDGSMGFWYNPGPVGEGWTEYGFDVADRATPNTRAIFYGVTPTHYAFHFWAIKGKQDPGRKIEDDTCNKV
ncbi:MAG TPA: hypothetical protein VGG89_08460 [Candidatus Baltobacteraceae bacterium]